MYAFYCMYPVLFCQVPLKEAWEEMYDSEYSTKYLFFPVKSRFTFPGSEAGAAEKLDAASNKIIKDDLDLQRIYPGFGTEAHKAYAGGQFVIGKSIKEYDKKLTTGSDFHCALGNNWFIQVAGKKRYCFYVQILIFRYL